MAEPYPWTENLKSSKLNSANNSQDAAFAEQGDHFAFSLFYLTVNFSKVGATIDRSAGWDLSVWMLHSPRTDLHDSERNKRQLTTEARSLPPEAG